jgi:hypothetical protein
MLDNDVSDEAHHDSGSEGSSVSRAAVTSSAKKSKVSSTHQSSMLPPPQIQPHNAENVPAPAPAPSPALTATTSTLFGILLHGVPYALDDERLLSDTVLLDPQNQDFLRRLYQRLNLHFTLVSPVVGTVTQATPFTTQPTATATAASVNLPQLTSTSIASPPAAFITPALNRRRSRLSISSSSFSLIATPSLQLRNRSINELRHKIQHMLLTRFFTILPFQQHPPSTSELPVTSSSSSYLNRLKRQTPSLDCRLYFKTLQDVEYVELLLFSLFILSQVLFIGDLGQEKASKVLDWIFRKKEFPKLMTNSNTNNKKVLSSSSSVSKNVILSIAFQTNTPQYTFQWYLLQVWIGLNNRKKNRSCRKKKKKEDEEEEEEEEEGGDSSNPQHQQQRQQQQQRRYRSNPVESVMNRNHQEERINMRNVNSNLLSLVTMSPMNNPSSSIPSAARIVPIASTAPTAFTVPTAHTSATTYYQSHHRMPPSFHHPSSSIVPSSQLVIGWNARNAVSGVSSWQEEDDDGNFLLPELETTGPGPGQGQVQVQVQGQTQQQRETRLPFQQQQQQQQQEESTIHPSYPPTNPLHDNDDDSDDDIMGDWNTQGHHFFDEIISSTVDEGDWRDFRHTVYSKTPQTVVTQSNELQPLVDNQNSNYDERSTISNASEYESDPNSSGPVPDDPVSVPVVSTINNNNMDQDTTTTANHNPDNAAAAADTADAAADDDDDADDDDPYAVDWDFIENTF